MWLSLSLAACNPAWLSLDFSAIPSAVGAAGLQEQVWDARGCAGAGGAGGCGVCFFVFVVFPPRAEEDEEGRKEGGRGQEGKLNK